MTENLGVDSYGDYATTEPNFAAMESLLGKKP
jgi:hypothetical protein